MKTSPSTVLDLALAYISQKYTHYYVLPDAGPNDRLRGVGKILDVVGEAALRYKNTKGCLFSSLMGWTYSLKYL